MNCALQKEHYFTMSEPLKKEEIEDMIVHAVREGFSEGLDDWQRKYQLGPEHWVFLRSLYKNSEQGKSAVLRWVVGSITTGISFLLGMGVLHWVNSLGG